MWEGGWGRGPGQQSGVRAGNTKLKSPSLACVRVGAGAPAGRSGVVLFTSPVDVLEEGHGEGHAQNLKDMGMRLRQKPHGGVPTRATYSNIHTCVPDTPWWSEDSGE